MSNDGDQFRPRRAESRLSSLKAAAHQEDHQIQDRIECRHCLATPPQSTLPRITITQNDSNQQAVAVAPAGGLGGGFGRGDDSGGCPHVSHPRPAQRDQQVKVKAHDAHEIQSPASIPAPRFRAQGPITSSAPSTVAFSASEGILSSQEELGRQEPNPEAVPEQARARQHVGGVGFGSQQGSLRIGVGPTSDYPTLATAHRLGVNSVGPARPRAATMPEAVTLGSSAGAEGAKGPESGTPDHLPEPRVSRASWEPERPGSEPEPEPVPAPVLGQLVPPVRPPPPPPTTLPPSGPVPVPVPAPRGPTPLSAGLTANMGNTRTTSTANVTNVPVPVDQRLITSRVSFPICPTAQLPAHLQFPLAQGVSSINPPSATHHPLPTAVQLFPSVHPPS